MSTSKHEISEQDLELLKTHSVAWLDRQLLWQGIFNGLAWAAVIFGALALGWFMVQL